GVIHPRARHARPQPGGDWALRDRPHHNQGGLGQRRHRRHRRCQPVARKPERSLGRRGIPMTSFNLSEWALRHKSIVVYLMLAAAIAGLWAYGKLGREEDPPFTIKTMVVKTVWPGATATDTLQQVTDRLEKKLEELPFLDFVRSYTKPGESVVFVNLKDTVGGVSSVQPLWYQVRKKIDDIRATLPSGVVGPFFNDEFGDT